MFNILKNVTLMILMIGLLLFGACNDPLVPVYVLTIQTDGDGTTTPAGIIELEPESGVYTISATSTGCSQFREWTIAEGESVIGDVTAETTTITVSGDTTIIAHFDPITYNLTVTAPLVSCLRLCSSLRSIFISDVSPGTIAASLKICALMHATFMKPQDKVISRRNPQIFFNLFMFFPMI